MGDNITSLPTIASQRSREYSFRRLASLPQPLQLQHQSSQSRLRGSSPPPLATVSSKRKLILSEEFQQIKEKVTNQCVKHEEENKKKNKKKRKEKRTAWLKMEYYNWDKWLTKRNGKVASRLTKREFAVFWSWYSSRTEVNSSENEESGGIRLDRAADDFMKIGLFESRPDAVAFLKDVDEDNSGFISFAELMSALSNAENASQVACMRKFVTSLTSRQQKKKATERSQNLSRHLHRSASSSSEVKQLPDIVTAQTKAMNGRNRPKVILSRR